MFQSPLKTVAEKLKPTDSKSTVSSLRFERSSDFKKFITFIKDETKELEKIKLPSATEIKPKKGASGLLGLGALGLVGLLGGAFGGGENEENLRLGSAGQTTPIKSNLVLTKNVRKVGKNVGGSKFFGSKKRFKQFRDLFEGKLKGVNLKSINQKLKGLKENLKEAKKRRANNIKTGNASLVFLDDALIASLKDQINSLKNEKKIFKKTGLSRNLSFDFKNLEAFRSIIDESKLNTPEGLKNKILLDKRISIDPEFAKLVKEVNKLDPLMFDVAEGSTLASKVFGRETGIKIESKMLRTRDFLDESFKLVGQKTKPLRNFFGSQLKNLGKTKIPGSRLVTFGKGIKFSSILKGGKGVFLPLDLLNFGLTFYDLAIAQGSPLGFVDFSDGATKPKIGRDNILTSLYDMFTSFYNAGVEGLGFSDANKRLFISKPKDQFITGSLIPFTNIGAYKTNPRREVDDYNKKILDARRMRDLFNRSLGSPINGQQNNLLKSVPFIESDSDGAEFSVGLSEPLNSFGLFTEYKLNQK